MCLPGTIETVREQTDREGVSRRALLAGGGAAAIAAAMPGVADARKRGGRGHGGHGRGPRFGKVTDLTHLFRAGFPVYTGDEPTRRTLKNYTPDGFYSQEWTFGEHSGTHLDAPGHFVEGGAPRPGAAARGAARAGRRDRHQRPGRCGPRRPGRGLTTCAPTSAATAASGATRSS